MKIGDKLKVLEKHYQHNRYVIYEIIDIIDKGLYNMYLCRNLTSGCKSVFTDKDFYEWNRKYLDWRLVYDKRDVRKLYEL